MLRHRYFASRSFRVVACGLAIAEALAVWFFSSRTWDAQTPHFPTGFGNLLHLLLFGALSAFLTFALAAHRSEECASGALIERRAVFITIVWGVVDEIHQWFVPGRDCSVADIVVDSFGALSASVFAMAVMRKGAAAKRWTLVGVFIGLGIAAALTLAPALPRFDGLIRILLDRIFCR